MKFRDPETGKVFDSIEMARGYFCTVPACVNCPLASWNNSAPKGLKRKCKAFCSEYPTEAARLMGYEVLFDDKEIANRKAHWIDNADSYICSACGHEVDNPNKQTCGAGQCMYCGAYMETKEDNMDKQDKPLSEWTLKEVQEMCDNQDDCPGCPFYTAENGCMFSGEAACWPLDEAGAVITPISDDIDAPIKPDKPRLAEALGVEVGQKWRVVCPEEDINSVEVWLNEKGHLIGETLVAGSVILCAAINHPESIIRAPRLTEPEIAIMRAVGAKWVSRNINNGVDCVVNCAAVYLWKEKPSSSIGLYFADGGPIATVNDPDLFPSVKPGDLIEYEKEKTK